jgi:hypothetical protein
VADEVIVIEDGSPAFTIVTDEVNLEIVGTGVPGPGGPAWAPIEGLNKDTVTLPAGTPAAVHSSGSGWVRASADSGGGDAVGLITADCLPNAAGLVRPKGPQSLNDWSAVTGAVSLAARGRYYLSATSGLLTTTPPGLTGQRVQLVGRAVDQYTLLIEVIDSVTL